MTSTLRKLDFPQSVFSKALGELRPMSSFRVTTVKSNPLPAPLQAVRQRDSTHTFRHKPLLLPRQE
jgi:hypothetical protein